MIVVNLNDVVRFRIRRDAIRIFHREPGIRIAPPDAAGDFPAEAQLHVLMAALDGSIKPWLTPPIHTDIEIVA